MGAQGSRGPGGAAAGPRTWADVAELTIENAREAGVVGPAAESAVDQRPKPPVRQAKSVRNPFNVVRGAVEVLGEAGGHLAIRCEVAGQCAGVVRVYAGAEQLPAPHNGQLFSSKAAFETAMAASEGLEVKTGPLVKPDTLLDELWYVPGSSTIPLVIEISREPGPADLVQALGQDEIADKFVVMFSLREKGTGFEAVEFRRGVVLDGNFFVVREMYGSTTSSDSEVDPSGKDCVVCLSETRDTTILPCLHMCLCRDCAQRLARSDAKCPLCRTDVSEFWHLDQASDIVTSPRTS